MWLSNRRAHAQHTVQSPSRRGDKSASLYFFFLPCASWWRKIFRGVNSLKIVWDTQGSGNQTFCAIDSRRKWWQHRGKSCFQQFRLPMMLKQWTLKRFVYVQNMKKTIPIVKKKKKGSQNCASVRPIRTRTQKTGTWNSLDALNLKIAWFVPMRICSVKLTDMTNNVFMN